MVLPNKYIVLVVLKCSELHLKCLKMLSFRGAAPDPAGGATAHPRPPSLTPRAFGARHMIAAYHILYFSAEVSLKFIFKVSPPTQKFWFDALLT